jgi:hypothetical protein
MSIDALNNLNDLGHRDIIKVAGAATLARAASGLVMASPAFGQNTARERISARGLSLHRTSSAPDTGEGRIAGSPLATFLGQNLAWRNTSITTPIAAVPFWTAITGHAVAPSAW